MKFIKSDSYVWRVHICLLSISQCEQNNTADGGQTRLLLALLPESDLRRPTKLVLLVNPTPATDQCPTSPWGRWGKGVMDGSERMGVQVYFPLHTSRGVFAK